MVERLFAQSFWRQAVLYAKQYEFHEQQKRREQWWKRLEHVKQWWLTCVATLAVTVLVVRAVTMPSPCPGVLAGDLKTMLA